MLKGTEIWVYLLPQDKLSMVLVSFPIIKTQHPSPHLKRVVYGSCFQEIQSMAGWFQSRNLIENGCGGAKFMVAKKQSKGTALKRKGQATVDSTQGFTSMIHPDTPRGDLSAHGFLISRLTVTTMDDQLRLSSSSSASLTKYYVRIPQCPNPCHTSGCPLDRQTKCVLDAFIFCRWAPYSVTSRPTGQCPG